MYNNASELVNISVFGCKAKKLVETLGCDRNTLRDALGQVLGWKVLLQLQKLEDTAASRIDNLDEDPMLAIKTAAEALLIKPIKLLKARD